MGLARQLIEAAKQYCSERWHVGGRRPLFLEISAEMLNYIDFLSSSGFLKVGDTEGNLERVVKDLISMRRGYEVSSGIMSLQKKYLASLLDYCQKVSKEVEDVLERLQEVLASPDPMSALSPDEWLGLRSIIRFPIPYYLCPLDDASEKFLRENVRPPKRRISTFRVEPSRVRIRGLRVISRYEIPHTRNTRMVMDAFGIRGEALEQSVLGPINVDASAGNIFFISGTSGSGKSAFLRALDTSDASTAPTLAVSGQGIRGYSSGWIRPLPSDVPIFEYLADRYSPQRALTALSQVGLSEAFVFLKPFPILSRGQRYRAMLADLLLRDNQVWLIDEFCSDLDPLSARIVCQNLRKQVMRSRRICFVAAANHGHFLHALRPTRVIVLSAGAPASLLTYRDYRDGFLKEAL
jgi:ABC-type lipoprotein export system ATPase subunit